MARQLVSKLENIGDRNEMTKPVSTSLPETSIKKFSKLAEDMGTNRSKILRIMIDFCSLQKNKEDLAKYIEIIDQKDSK